MMTMHSPSFAIAGGYRLHAPEAAARRRAGASPGPGGTGRPQPTTAAGGIYATPLVRELAARYGVDLAAVAGTGAGGRIRTSDVLAARVRSASGHSVPEADTGAMTPSQYHEHTRRHVVPIGSLAAGLADPAWPGSTPRRAPAPHGTGGRSGGSRVSGGSGGYACALCGRHRVPIAGAACAACWPVDLRGESAW